MTHEQRVARHASLNAEMTRVLTEYKDILGPEIDVDGVPCSCDADPCPCSVPEGYLPTDWVLLGNWTDFGSADGSAAVQDDWMHVESATSMRKSQIAGLLLMALDSIRGVS